jgi:alkyl hydroperoxide reductase subunit AhpC
MWTLFGLDLSSYDNFKAELEWQQTLKRFSKATKVRLFMTADDREDIDKFLHVVQSANTWCKANVGPERDQWFSNELSYYFIDPHQALMFKLVCG